MTGGGWDYVPEFHGPINTREGSPGPLNGSLAQILDPMGSTRRIMRPCTNMIRKVYGGSLDYRVLLSWPLGLFHCFSRRG